jgi:hypothetical protein
VPSGKATFDGVDIDAPDSFTVGNALFPEIAPVPAKVSFETTWNMPRNPYHWVSEEFDLEGRFRSSEDPDVAKVAWRGENDEGFSYESDPIETSINHYAILGIERNGEMRYGRWASRNPKG